MVLHREPHLLSSPLSLIPPPGAVLLGAETPRQLLQNIRRNVWNVLTTIRHGLGDRPYTVWLC